MKTNWLIHIYTGSLVYPSQCLVLVKDSRTTDLWLGLLVISDQNHKLKTTMNIPNILIGTAAKAALSVQGVNKNTWGNVSEPGADIPPIAIESSQFDLVSSKVMAYGCTIYDVTIFKLRSSPPMLSGGHVYIRTFNY
jgi:hypothetical protein